MQKSIKKGIKTLNMKQKKKKWQLSDELAGKPLNWHKVDSQTIRRRNALASRKQDALAAARALLALANVTNDKETKRKARSDYIALFKAHADKQKRIRR